MIFINKYNQLKLKIFYDQLIQSIMGATLMRSVFLSDVSSVCVAVFMLDPTFKNNPDGVDAIKQSVWSGGIGAHDFNTEN